MSESFGTGVSRTLSAKDHQFSSVVWQKGKPPLDSELNLVAQIASEFQDKLSEANTPSGWVGDPTRCEEDFITNKNWSNFFKFGTQRSQEKRGFPIAVVNGWVIPVTGTRVGNPPASPNDTDFSNRIKLSPPPSSAGDNRVDFVFLEVWRTQLSPGGLNHKPTVDGVYKYGNTEFGGSNLSDDIQDPAIGFETSERAQIQYRIRVVDGISLANSNNGFDSGIGSVVFGQGGATSNSSYNFANMRKELGDVGLWRAGDGDPSNSLGTIDGYTYAIPISVVFRRNSEAYAETNQNGGVNRNNAAVTRDDAVEFVNTATLASAISITDAALALNTIVSTGVPTYGNIIRIDDELMSYVSVVGNVLNISNRKYNNSKSQSHKAGAIVYVQPGRPDGLFSDQIVREDILDLRNVVSVEGLDFNRLLRFNLNKLFKGELHSTWKRSGAAGVQGSKLLYVDRIASATGIGVNKIDAPDNHRIIFSDAATAQTGNLCIAIPPAAYGSDLPATPVDFDLGVTCTAFLGTASQWNEHDVITIPILQFKAGFPTGQTESVRFVTPTEFASALVIYVDGDTTAYTQAGGHFTVASTLTTSDNLVITLASSWPSGKVGNLHILFTLQYSAGRGLSRTPTDMLEAKFASTPVETLLRYTNKLHMESMQLWGRVNPTGYQGDLVRNSEAYVDLGSKTIVVTPYRKIDVSPIRVKDGTTLNGSLGLMPVGASPKDITDPLNLFESNSQTVASLKNLYVEMPKDWLCMPTKGDVYAPVLPAGPTDTLTPDAVFDGGINYFVYHTEGLHSALSNNMKNYVNTNQATSQQFLSTTVSYNRSGTTGSVASCGARKYSSGGRTGLELPPFYGVARCWAVYESADFISNGSAFNSTDRTPLTTGTPATNLLRPDYDDAPFFIIEDVDGDATFVINSAAIDLNRLATPPSSFMSGDYVIEASLFGFDRGFGTTNARLVLSRARAEAVDTSIRGNNVGTPIAAPNFVVPAPLSNLASLNIQYSRIPYQGDVWGSQEATIDSPIRAGCLSSQEIKNILDNPTIYAGMTLNNQKNFEILDTCGFMTTLGSGSLSFTYSMYSGKVQVGYEDPAVFPPATISDPLPRVKYGAMTANNFDAVTPTYNNVIGNLPLGSLFRDKDFLGESLGWKGDRRNQSITPMDLTHKIFVEVPKTSNYLLESQSINGRCYTELDGSSYITVVDGVTNNTLDTTKYRTNRGGSAYVVSRPIPGGPIDGYLGSGTFHADFNSCVLVGVALLVRNFPESVSGIEKISGDELELVVVTQAYRPRYLAGNTVELSLLNSPSGSGEGYGAVDRFRLMGHPVVQNKTRYEPDNSTVTIAKKV
jgi:hypothetical protein